MAIGVVRLVQPQRFFEQSASKGLTRLPQGLTIVGGSAADFRRTIEADVKRWGPLIKRIGFTVDS